MWRGLEHVLRPGVGPLPWTLVGLLVGWWIYVPLHELLHAAGCVLTGGEVTRLEIARAYGGDLYAAVFDFVVPESEYAGRLSGFSTFGNDWIYLATDLAPFLLTVFPGVWALRRAVAHERPFFYGFWLPFALAPFLSLTGDAYEIGSILVTQISPWSAQADLLRSDDLFLWIDTHRDRSGIPWAGAVLATLIGAVWAAGTYALGSLTSTALGRGPIPALDFSEADPSAADPGHEEPRPAATTEP